mmetsp:Transcript_5859/g.14140  ORF Transcript_5859/g.14140 Transcript_5859/m.14140 type:complete len:108 (+) Transcript_5859:1836-2159(+)
MIMKLLVASSGLLEPGCIATELVDLNTGATLNVLDEFEMRPYSLSMTCSMLLVHRHLHYRKNPHLFVYMKSQRSGESYEEFRQWYNYSLPQSLPPTSKFFFSIISQY